MSTTEVQSERALSIDIFRGLTVLVMVFVNDLGRVGIPSWMQHAAASEDRMTFVDVVFPAFLFIVGMSMPLARAARIRKGSSPRSVHIHALLRAAGLLVMGYFLVNRWHFNAEVALVDYMPWTFGVHLCILLVWNIWPTDSILQRRIKWSAITTGWLGFALLFYLFCGGDWAHMMGRSWWGILGLIGWAYFISYWTLECTRAEPTLLGGVLLVLVGLRVATGVDGFSFPVGLGWLADFAQIGIMALLTICGALVSLRFFGEGAAETTIRSKLTWLLGFSLLLLAAGALFRPDLGASKIRATPTWGLYSAAFCCQIFGLLYYVLDVKKKRGWARFFESAGQNPLLLYLLPGLFFSSLGWLGVTVLDDHFGSGGMRMLRASLLALGYLLVSAWLTKRGLRVKL